MKQQSPPDFHDLDPKFDTRATCASPFCATKVSVRGEFCRECRAQQQRMADELRRQKERDALKAR